MYAPYDHGHDDALADAIEDARQEVNRLSQVLVHDCDPRSERCWCFGQGDVDAYEAAKRHLADLRTRGARWSNA